jgi:hypothetical protein
MGVTLPTQTSSSRLASPAGSPQWPNDLLVAVGLARKQPPVAKRLAAERVVLAGRHGRGVRVDSLDDSRREVPGLFLLHEALPRVEAQVGARGLARARVQQQRHVPLAGGVAGRAGQRHDGVADAVARIELVDEAAAVGRRQQDAALAAQRLGREDLLARVGVLGVDKARRVHLHAVHVDKGRARRPEQVVRRGSLVVGRRQVREVRLVLRQQAARVAREAAGRKDHGARGQAVRRAVMGVAHAGHGARVRQRQRRDLGAARQLKARVLAELLEQRADDGEARRALGAAVRPRHRVPAQRGHDAEVNVKLASQPAHGARGPGREPLDQALAVHEVVGARLPEPAAGRPHRVVVEEVVLRHAAGLLESGAGAVDTR